MGIKISSGAFESVLSTGSFKDTFTNGVLCIYSGTQPSNADAAETGTLLAEVNVDGAVFTPGGATGLNFGAATGKSIAKDDTETWKGIFLEDGLMGWFRFYDNSKTTGASTSAIRIDGSVGTSRTDIIVGTTTATLDGSITFDDFTLNFSVYG